MSFEYRFTSKAYDTSKVDNDTNKAYDINKVACFDLDFTIICPKNHKRFSGSVDDWELVYPTAISRIKTLHDLGWKIVIFTNQKTSKKSITFADLCKKIDNVFANTDIDVDVFMSSGDDYCRKPMLGMWDKFIELNGKPNQAFYVGDAAGRRSDFSDSDRRFAYNAKIPFYLPHEILGKPSENNNDVVILDANFVPTHHEQVTLKDIPIHAKFPKPLNPLPQLIKYITEHRRVVLIMMGRPASGKSYLSACIKKHINDAVVLSNDVTGSIAKTKKLLINHFANNEDSEFSVVIVDNTNPSIKARGELLDNVPDDYKKICVHATLEQQYCVLLDEYRAYQKKTKTIPIIAYRMYTSKYEPVVKCEGFTLKYNYVPNCKFLLEQN